MTEPLFDLAGIILSLLIYLVLTRVLLQLCRADRYNPLAMGIARFTDTFLAPLRRVLPSVARWDLAGVLVLIVLGLLSTVITNRFGLMGFVAPPVWILSLIELLSTIMDMYKVFIILIVVASFVAQGSYHPALELLRQLTEPLLSPVRRRLPAVGGLDFSPLIVLTALWMAQKYLLPALIQLLL